MYVKDIFFLIIKKQPFEKNLSLEKEKKIRKHVNKKFVKKKHVKAIMVLTIRITQVLQNVDLIEMFMSYDYTFALKTYHVCDLACRCCRVERTTFYITIRETDRQDSRFCTSLPRAHYTISLPPEVYVNHFDCLIACIIIIIIIHLKSTPYAMVLQQQKEINFLAL